MKDMIKRYFFFILGLIINSFGIAFITKSALGTSPISSVPYVFSLRFDGFSFGGFTFIMNMLFILLQVLLLRKNFQLIQLLQIGANFLFSAFIDVGMSALSWLNPSSIPLRLISLAIGCVILAFGICVEVAPDVIVVPGEGIVRAISRVSGREFGKVKICFDVTLIAISSFPLCSFSTACRASESAQSSPPWQWVPSYPFSTGICPLHFLQILTGYKTIGTSGTVNCTDDGLADRFRRPGFGSSGSREAGIRLFMPHIRIL